jgi:hypothetical protein
MDETKEIALDNAILAGDTTSWESFFRARAAANVPDEFMADRRNDPPRCRPEPSGIMKHEERQ